MIAYVRGTLAYVDPEEGSAVVESGGIGYRIFVAGRDLDLLPPAGSELRLYTYFQVKEDGMLLYGFFTREDQRLFKLLIGVNGIGPKGALGILSALSAEDLRFAVLAGDAKAISKAPGIGNKTAQKLILDLKDKLQLSDAFEAKLEKNRQREVPGLSASADIRREAAEALAALGYSPTEALKAVRRVEIEEEMRVEDLLKAALKQMAF